MLKRSRDFRKDRENQTSWQVISVRATVSGTSDAYACTKRKRAASVEFFFQPWLRMVYRVRVEPVVKRMESYESCAND